MKRYLQLFLSAIIAITLAACAVDTPQTKPLPESDTKHTYTIMYYCCGGGDLDKYFEDVANVHQYTKEPLTENINLVGQIKWSEGYHSEHSDGSGKVSRFKYDHKSNSNNYNDFASANYPMVTAENLAEFISWAKETTPADEYIMIFAGHGNGYHPAFDHDATRGTIRNDSTNEYLGIQSIRQACEMTGTHFSLMQMICCLVNCVEYVSELEPYVDYYLASCHASTISGGEIYYITEALMQMEEYDALSVANSSKHLVNATYDYYDADIDLWPITMEHTVTECEKIAGINEAIRGFVDRVVELYDSEAEIGSSAMLQQYGFSAKDIDNALCSAYYPVMKASSEPYLKEIEWYRRCYMYDIVDIAHNVAEATNDADIRASAEAIRSACEEAIYSQRSINLDDVERVYYTVTLVNKSQYEALGYEESGYEATAFDLATGWSRLLKRNNAQYFYDDVAEASEL